MCRCRKDIFLLPFYRSYGLDRRKNEREEKKRSKMSALTRLSNAYLTRVCMLLKEFRAGTRSLHVRLSLFFFLLPLHFFTNTQMDSRSTDAIALAFLRFLIYPCLSHHHHHHHHHHRHCR
jgi:hypothetical protein